MNDLRWDEYDHFIVMPELDFTMEWHAPDSSLMQSLKGALIRVMDVSEYIQPWMHQDFRNTLDQVGLEVVSEEVLTLRFHRLTVCQRR